MAFNRDKFKSLVHYVCWSCKDDPSRLGAVKLNKILWLSDFLTYYRAGDSITGARYIKRQFGPVPSSIVPILHELEAERKLIERDAPYHGLVKKEYIVLRDPSITFFQDEEKKVVDRMIAFVCDEHTAKSISEGSHDHVWQSAEDGEEIPYFTVFSVPGEIMDDERDWARQELEVLGR